MNLPERAREIARKIISIPPYARKTGHEWGDLIEKEMLTLAREVREETVRECANTAKELSCGFHSPWEYSEDVSEEILKLLPTKAGEE